MKIGIIGYGFVGKAIHNGFLTPNVEFCLVDPLLGTTIEYMMNQFKPDVAFISVPTPMNQNGAIDDSIIIDCLRQINSHDKNLLCVIKSTVTPDVIHSLKSIHSKLVYNPEFLTEKNANEDFINSEFLLLGGEETDINLVEFLYKKYSKCVPCPTFKVDMEAASIIKYSINCFLASKVIFFNQLNSIYKKSGSKTDWEKITEVIGSDSRIGKSHMQTPGHDGKYGFGGACFPKDTLALIRYSQQTQEPFTLLQQVVDINQNIRNNYELDHREKQQNIKFDIGIDNE